MGQLSRENEDPFDKLGGNNLWKGVPGLGNKEYAVCETSLHDQARMAAPNRAPRSLDEGGPNKVHKRKNGYWENYKEEKIL